MIPIKIWEGELPFAAPGADGANLMEFFPTDASGKRPCVVVLPGGGYGKLAPHEGRPVAEFFNRKGMHAAVVYYRLKPNRYPAALADAQRAIRILRARAEELAIDTARIVSLGFSAGGNLSASLAVLEDVAKNGDALDEISPVPNGAVLCYAALDLHDPKIGSGRALFAEELPRFVEGYSLQNRVTAKTPPIFLWHTSDDPGVRVYHSLTFAKVLRDNGVPFELHIYPHGRHGLGLGEETEDVCGWAELAVGWIERNI